MPKRTPFNDAELRKITEKYIKSVSRDVSKIPKIDSIITEAFKSHAPNKAVDPADVQKAISTLSKRPIINDKTIQEVTRKIHDTTAVEDLKFMVSRNIRQVGKRPTPEEIQKIITQGKLNPDTSSLAHIKAAVQKFYSTEKPLEAVTPAELRTIIKTELEKHGSVDDRDLKALTTKYLDTADQDRPVDKAALQRLVQSHIASKAPQTASTAIPAGLRPSQTRGPNAKNQDAGDGGKPPIKAGPFVPPKNPKTPTFFEKVRLKLQRYGIKSLTRGSRNWLTDNVNKANKPPGRKTLVVQGQSVAEALIGKMFLYFYDAKTKDELPYWDKFPLIFVIELYEDGWLGLNLHYLDMNLRMKLFDKLLAFANDKRLDKIKKLKLSYALLKSVAQFPEVRPCIKRYLTTQIRSELITVDPIDWEIALFLPVEQFQKQTKEHVWRESKQKINTLRGLPTPRK